MGRIIVRDPLANLKRKWEKALFSIWNFLIKVVSSMNNKILLKGRDMDFFRNRLELFLEIPIKILPVFLVLLIVDQPGKRMENNKRLQQKVGP